MLLFVGRCIYMMQKKIVLWEFTPTKDEFVSGKNSKLCGFSKKLYIQTIFKNIPKAFYDIQWVSWMSEIYVMIVLLDTICCLPNSSWGQECECYRLIVAVPLLPLRQVWQEAEGLLSRDADIHLHLKTQHVVFLQCVQPDLKYNTSKNTRWFFQCKPRSLQFLAVVKTDMLIDTEMGGKWVVL